MDISLNNFKVFENKIFNGCIILYEYTVVYIPMPSLLRIRLFPFFLYYKWCCDYYPCAQIFYLHLWFYSQGRILQTDLWGQKLYFKALYAHYWIAFQIDYTNLYPHQFIPHWYKLYQFIPMKVMVSPYPCYC